MTSLYKIMQQVKVESVTQYPVNTFSNMLLKSLSDIVQIDQKSDIRYT